MNMKHCGTNPKTKNRYEEDPLEKYRDTLIFPDQLLVLHLKKERFPTLADAVDLLLKTARGTGRMAIDADGLGDAIFPAAVFFRYGRHIIGKAVLVDAEVELDGNLRPATQALVFDADTLAVYFDPITCAELNKWWKEQQRDFHTLYDFIFFMEDCLSGAQLYPTRGDRGVRSLQATRAGAAVDGLADMAFHIRNTANALDIPGLTAHAHRRIRLSGEIKTREYGLSEEELAEFENADLPPYVKAEDYRGGKCIVLGEFNPENGDVILYVHAIMLSCIAEGGSDKDAEFEDIYRARLFSVLAHELFHAFHFDVCGMSRWEELQPREDDNLHRKCRRMEWLCVAESLASAFAYICCAYKAQDEHWARADGTERAPYSLTADWMYAGIAKKPIPGWPYAGMKLLLGRLRDAYRRMEKELREYERGGWRHDAYGSGCYLVRGRRSVPEVYRLLRREKSPDLGRVFELSIKGWGKAYSCLTGREN